MARIREDQSVAPASLPTRNSMAKSKDSASDKLCRGMVLRVRYVDDPLNQTINSQNPQVTYDVILTSGPREGQIFSNVRSMNLLGGQDNYSEILYRAASKPFTGPDGKPFQNQDGDVVYLEFINGDLSSPLITGLGNHPLDRDKTGATKAHGPRWIQEYNGVNTLVDKDGNYKLVRKGGVYNKPTDSFVPVDDGNEAEIQMTANQLQLGAGKDSVTQILDGKNLALTSTVGTNGAVQILDGKNGIITIKTKALSVIIDSKANKVTVTAAAGSAEIELDGNSGKISLKGSNVDVGTAASHMAVLGDSLLSWLNSHFHMIGITPTTPPTIPADSSLLSATVKIQA